MASSTVFTSNRSQAVRLPEAVAFPNICIYVMKNYPQDLREKFNSLAEQLCISSITLGELHYGADNLTAIEQVAARFHDEAEPRVAQVSAPT